MCADDIVVTSPLTGAPLYSGKSEVFCYSRARENPGTFRADQGGRYSLSTSHRPTADIPERGRWWASPAPTDAIVLRSVRISRTGTALHGSRPQRLAARPGKLVVRRRGPCDSSLSHALQQDVAWPSGYSVTQLRSSLSMAESRG